MKFENEIIDMYNSGYKCDEIVEKIDCCKTHIYNVLKKNNIKLRLEPIKKKQSRFNPIDVANMYQLYRQGKTSSEIGEIYGASSSTIIRLFHQNEYECRNSNDAHRKYTINEYFFDEIDTQEKAYILGLIYADGCNQYDRNKIEISLQEKDKNLLYQIRDILGMNKPLHISHSTYPGGQDMYRLEVVSKHMCNILLNIGVTPRKSLSIVFPKINDNLISHFIRGYFDGDGYISKPEKRGCQIEIMGTLMFCESLYDILHNVGIDCYIRNTNRPETITRYLVIGKKKECEKFCNYIYNDATIYMKRKFDKAFQKFHSTFNLHTSNECV